MFDIGKVSNEVFKTLRSYSYEVAMFDSDGNKTYEPETAIRYFTSKKNMTISISKDGDNSSIKMLIGVSVNTSSIIGLIKSFRNLASKYGLMFNIQKYRKEIEPKDFINGNLSEGYKKLEGSSKSSYLKLEGAKMIVRHSSKVDEDKRGARSRNINSLMIENKAGERFLMPYNNLPSGKAMARHVSEGGHWADEKGESLLSLTEQQEHLRTCIKHCRKNRKQLDENINELVEQCRDEASKIKKIFDSVYGNYSKNISKLNNNILNEEDMSEQVDALVERLKLEEDGVMDKKACETVVKLTGGQLNEKKSEEMVRLEALGKEVESSAWEEFKNGIIRLKSTLPSAKNFGKDTDIQQQIVMLQDIAKCAAKDGIGNLISSVAYDFDSGVIDDIRKAISKMAISAASKPYKEGSKTGYIVESKLDDLFPSPNSRLAGNNALSDDEYYSIVADGNEYRFSSLDNARKKAEDIFQETGSIVGITKETAKNKEGHGLHGLPIVNEAIMDLNDWMDGFDIDKILCEEVDIDKFDVDDFIDNYDVSNTLGVDDALYGDDYDDVLDEADIERDSFDVDSFLDAKERNFGYDDDEDEMNIYGDEDIYILEDDLNETKRFGPYEYEVVERGDDKDFVFKLGSNEYGVYSTDDDMDSKYALEIYVDHMFDGNGANNSQLSNVFGKKLDLEFLRSSYLKPEMKDAISFELFEGVQDISEGIYDIKGSIAPEYVKHEGKTLAIWWADHDEYDVYDLDDDINGKYSLERYIHSEGGIPSLEIEAYDKSLKLEFIDSGSIPDEMKAVVLDDIEEGLTESLVFEVDGQNKTIPNSMSASVANSKFADLYRWSDLDDDKQLISLVATKGKKDWYVLFGKVMDSGQYDVSMRSPSSGGGYPLGTDIDSMIKDFHNRAKRSFGGNMVNLYGPEIEEIKASAGNKISKAQFMNEFKKHKHWAFKFGKQADSEERMVSKLKSNSIIFYRVENDSYSSLHFDNVSGLLFKNGNDMIVLNPVTGEPKLTYSPIGEITESDDEQLSTEDVLLPSNPSDNFQDQIKTKRSKEDIDKMVRLAGIQNNLK